MTTDLTPHIFWITSRAAGFAALILASLGVSLGLLMSTKLLKRRGPDLLAAHEIIALSTIVAIVVHGVALLGDSYLKPSIADISIPFVSSYKSGWTSLGIVAGWGLVILGLSYYARRRIGAKRWRTVHRFTALAWLAGLAHALGEGTDAGQVWFLAMLAIVALPALALLATRWLGSGSSPAHPRLGSRSAHPRPESSSAHPRPGSGPALGGAAVPAGPEHLHDLPARGAVAPAAVAPVTAASRRRQRAHEVALTS